MVLAPQIEVPISMPKKPVKEQRSIAEITGFVNCIYSRMRVRVRVRVRS
jgi:hypothetical protein